MSSAPSVNVLLLVFNPLTVRLEHGKIAVDDRVDNRVCQIVGPQAADVPRLLPQPLAHRIEAVARRLLKREHEILPQENADLFVPQPLSHYHHAGDNEQPLLKIFHLCPLVRVDHIFQSQRMQAVEFADPRNGSGVP